LQARENKPPDFPYINLLTVRLIPTFEPGIHPKVKNFLSKNQRQNGILPNATLVCKIECANLKRFNYFDPTPDFSSQATQKTYKSEKNYIMRGLNLEAICKNPRCMENGNKKLVAMGFGNFKWDQ
jgi:hypothetical protein